MAEAGNLGLRLGMAHDDPQNPCALEELAGGFSPQPAPTTVPSRVGPAPLPALSPGADAELGDLLSEVHRMQADRPGRGSHVAVLSAQLLAE